MLNWVFITNPFCFHDLFFFDQKHKVPVSAIPCLQYRKALEKEKQRQEMRVNEELKEVVEEEEEQLEEGEDKGKAEEEEIMDENTIDKPQISSGKTLNSNDEGIANTNEEVMKVGSEANLSPSEGQNENQSSDLSTDTNGKIVFFYNAVTDLSKLCYLFSIISHFFCLILQIFIFSWQLWS